MVNKMIAKDIHKINKRWSKEAGTEPSDLQAYMYYFETLKFLRNANRLVNIERFE